MTLLNLLVNNIRNLDLCILQYYAIKKIKILSFLKWTLGVFMIRMENLKHGIVKFTT